MPSVFEKDAEIIYSDADLQTMYTDSSFWMEEEAAVFLLFNFLSREKRRR